MADELGVSRDTVAKWRSRFLRDRLEGLTDEPRPGRPRTVGDEQVEAVITATLEQALCGPKTSSTSCDQAIFLDQATDASLLPDATLAEVDWLG